MPELTASKAAAALETAICTIVRRFLRVQTAAGQGEGVPTRTGADCHVNADDEGHDALIAKRPCRQRFIC